VNAVFRSLLLLAASCLMVTTAARADDFRPAYLQLRQIDATTYDVLWKAPALDAGTSLRVQPVFPAGSRTLTQPVASHAGNAAVLRWKVAADGGLTGKVIEFPGLAETRIDVLVRLDRIAAF
jgi:hypothetical protein